MKKIALSIIFIFYGFILVAQDKWSEPAAGELEDSQIIIEKNRALDLPRVGRNFRQVPAVDRQQDSISVNFNWNEITPELSKLKPGLRVLRIKDEPLPKLFANQVSAGLGNYGATYLSGFLGNKRDRNKSYGVQFYHKNFNRGAVDKRYSGSGYQMISPHAKFFNEKMSIETAVIYDRINNFAYGLAEENRNLNENFKRSEFRKTFQNVGANVAFADRNIANNLDYNYQLGFYHFFGNSNNAETNFNFELDNSYNFNNAFGAKLKVEGYVSNYNFSDEAVKISRNLVQVKPKVTYRQDDFLIDGGFNISVDKNSTFNKSDVYVLPDLGITYYPLSKTYLSARITGDVNAVTAKSLVSANPFLDPLTAISNSVTPFKLQFGAGANLFKKVQADASFGVATIKDLTFFNNTTIISSNGADLFTSNTFIVDDNITAISASLFLQTDFGKNFDMQIKGDYLNYSDDSINNFPNVPKFKVDIFSNFTIKEKLEIGFNIFAQSEMVGLLRTFNGFVITDEVIKIDPFVDLGLSARYNLTSMASVFVDANNLLANEYQYYLNYPNRGFQLLVGFTYSF